MRAGDLVRDKAERKYWKVVARDGYTVWCQPCVDNVKFDVEELELDGGPEPDDATPVPNIEKRFPLGCLVRVLPEGVEHIRLRYGLEVSPGRFETTVASHDTEPGDDGIRACWIIVPVAATNCHARINPDHLERVDAHLNHSGREGTETLQRDLSTPRPDAERGTESAVVDPALSDVGVCSEEGSGQVGERNCCRTCEFWKAPDGTEPVGIQGDGECRRRSPQPHAVMIDDGHGGRVDAHLTWPLTDPDNWCGEYRLRSS